MNIVLHLETLSPRADAAVLSIECTLCGDEPTSPKSTYIWHLDVDDQVDEGRTIDWAHLTDLIGQCDTERQRLFFPNRERELASTALIHMARLFEEVSKAHVKGIWFSSLALQGATFKHLSEQCGFEPFPTHLWRDAATVSAVVPG